MTDERRQKLGGQQNLSFAKCPRVSVLTEVVT